MQSFVQGAVDRGVELGICFRDARLSPHQNVNVRGRLIAIVIALAVLAFAEIRDDGQAPPAQRHSDGAPGQLADPPAPESDVPAVITAAVSTSAPQTVLVVETRRVSLSGINC